MIPIAIRWTVEGSAVMTIVLHAATTMLIGIVIFVGLPLFGGGVRDAQSFISHPARLGTEVTL
jgi:hypothetical protein